MVDFENQCNLLGAHLNDRVVVAGLLVVFCQMRFVFVTSVCIRNTMTCALSHISCIYIHISLSLSHSLYLTYLFKILQVYIHHDHICIMLYVIDCYSIVYLLSLSLSLFLCHSTTYDINHQPRSRTINEHCVAAPACMTHSDAYSDAYSDA